MKEKLLNEIENRFTFHPPFGDQAERYGRMRSLAKALATEIVEGSPESREQSLALTKLDEVVFWTNAAIVRHEKEDAGRILYRDKE